MYVYPKRITIKTEKSSATLYNACTLSTGVFTTSLAQGHSTLHTCLGPFGWIFLLSFFLGLIKLEARTDHLAAASQPMLEHRVTNIGGIRHGARMHILFDTIAVQTLSKRSEHANDCPKGFVVLGTVAYVFLGVYRCYCSYSGSFVVLV